MRNNFYASAEKLNIGNSFIFQQDNDPKHTTKKLKNGYYIECQSNLTHRHNHNIRYNIYGMK